MKVFQNDDDAQFDSNSRSKSSVLNSRFILTYGDTICVAIVGILSLLRLPEPLWGDQALFMVGGEAIRNGAVLYRDFWDVKPPGIFGAYTLAGTLFGFSGVGMHVLDVLWMGALGLMLRLTLARYFARSWIAILLPWMAVGLYLSVIQPNDQMQVESLVGLPIYTLVWCTWMAVKQPEHRSRWLFLSGVAGGVVLLFKLIFLPFIAGFWLVYLLHSLMRQRQSFVSAVGHLIVPVTLGILMPIVPVMIYWASQGMLGEIYYTLVQHPARMVKELPSKPISEFMSTSVGWFKRSFPLLVLASLAGARLWKRMDFLMIQMVVWLGLGLTVISVQTLSWWAYHFFLFLVPMTVLAGKGIEVALQSAHAKWGRVVVAIALAVLLVLNVRAIVKTGYAMTRSGLPINPENLLAYQKRISPLYSSLVNEAQWVNAPGRVPGAIYVIGNPTLYVLSHRTQAIAFLGWIPEMMLREQWTVMGKQLDKARPVYLYIDKSNVQYIPSEFWPFVNRLYKSAQETTEGTWYELV